MEHSKETLKKIVLMELTRTPSPALESSSSSEDEPLAVERNQRISIENYLDTINAYSDEEFKSHFRLTRKTALKLIDLYRPNIKIFKGGWNHISAEHSVYITIWYLANMESYRQVADRFNITRSCSLKTIRTVVEFLVEQSPMFICWPTEPEAAIEATSFFKKQGLENVIGAIDGCHIKIIRPIEHEEDFVNRKGYHSKILQGVVNSKGLFIDVAAGYPGSMHDARVFRKCKLYKVATENNITLFFNKYYLVGDSAYPSLGWLKPPHKDNGHLSDQEKLYNYQHSATRIVVEHAFGILKGRFRRLRSFENLNQPFINNCIVAACVLHNICLTDNDIIDEIFEDVDMDS